MRKKIALVNQRYGLEVNGGSELHCRQLAEKLSEIYDVEVITTCALDYVTWANYYKEGTEIINGVTVRRFKVERERETESFNRFSDKVLIGKHSDDEEEQWIDMQGPFCPAAVSYISEHHSDYAVVIFMTYLYYITARGMALNLDNAFLLPTAHDEPPVYLRYYKRVFENAKSLIYLTEEEKCFVEKQFNVEGIANVITGSGVDVPDQTLINRCKFSNLPQNYVFYVGRIDESKGCGLLFDYFLKYKSRAKSELKLVLAGKSVMNIPLDKDIIHMGFVNDEEKFYLYQHSRALVLASEFESLSMVVLESMACSKPVLLNGTCSVLKGHCEKSGAGLYFENYYEFETALDFLLTHKRAYEDMCENGKRYVEENYRWNVIISKICELIGYPDEK